VLNIKHGISSFEDQTPGARSFMLLISELTPAYFAVMLAGVLHGFVIIPIHAEIEMEGLVSILSKTRPVVVVISRRAEKKVIEALQKSGMEEKRRLLLELDGREVWPVPAG
jgi:long-subunit acyl-CoA synthetase (AMP-forming)